MPVGSAFRPRQPAVFLRVAKYVRQVETAVIPSLPQVFPSPAAPKSRFRILHFHQQMAKGRASPHNLKIDIHLRGLTALAKPFRRSLGREFHLHHHLIARQDSSFRKQRSQQQTRTLRFIPQWSKEVDGKALARIQCARPEVFRSGNEIPPSRLIKVALLL